MTTDHNTDIVDAPELHKNTRSGRASWDERGNTVWEWQTEPGIYSREVNTQQLKTLQASELQLLDQSPGVTSTYSHWKRQYPERAAKTRGTELVMPETRKVAAVKNGMFESFLKDLGFAD